MVNSYKGSILFIYFGEERWVVEGTEKDRTDRSRTYFDMGIIVIYWEGACHTCILPYIDQAKFGHVPYSCSRSFEHQNVKAGRLEAISERLTT